MASIKIEGRVIDAPVSGVELKEVGFGADEIAFKIGEIEVSIPVLELIEISTPVPVVTRLCHR